MLVRRRLTSKATHRMQMAEKRLLVPFNPVLAAKHFAELRSAEEVQAFNREDVIDPSSERLDLRRDAAVKPKARGKFNEFVDIFDGHTAILPIGTKWGTAEARLKKARTDERRELLE